MFQKFFYKYLLIVSLIFAYGCSSKNKTIFAEPKTAIPLEKLYAEAYQNFKSNKYQDAIELFEEVEKNYTIKSSDLSVNFKEKSFNSEEIQVVV